MSNFNFTQVSSDPGTIGDILDIWFRPDGKMVYLQDDYGVDKIFQYTGTYINGNFYFSAGSTKHRVSFDPHEHNYNVILTGVRSVRYKVLIFGKYFELGIFRL